MRAYFSREWAIYQANRGSWQQNLVLFALLNAMFLIGLGALTASVAAVVLWVLVLIVLAITEAQLFKVDHAAGVLPQVFLKDGHFYFYLFAKYCLMFYVFFIPMMLIALVMAALFAVPFVAILVFALALIFAAPALLLLIGLGAALTAGLSGGGLLVAILILPLLLPILILGLICVEYALTAGPFMAPLAILAAISLVCFVFLPQLTQSGLKMSMEN